MSLTYEQLAPALHKWAFIYAKKYPQFQVDELVNAVWLIGRVQKLKHIKFASRRVRYDMIDYMRKQTRCRVDARLRGQGKFVPTTQSLQHRLTDDLELQDTIAVKTNLEHADIDTRDLFDKLCKGMSRMETLIVKLLFIEGFGQVEIGKVAGLSESRISQMLTNLLPRMRVILKNLGLDERVNRKLGQSPREKQNFGRVRNHRLYNRIYYIANRDRIGARRKRQRLAMRGARI